MNGESRPGPSPAKVMGVALLAGASIFLVVAVALPFVMTLAPQEAPDIEFLTLLSGAHAMIAIGALGAAVFLRGRAALAEGQAAMQLRLARWAVLEGAALFGIVVVLLAGLNGVVPADPVWYANLVTYVIFAAALVRDLGELPH